MSEKPLRIGLIGCGVQGQVHLRCIRQIGQDKARVAALCDLSQERLEKVGQEWPGTRRAADFRTMLEPGDLDLVIVATMPNTHARLCIAALEAGAHVLCEKPFMMNAEEAQAVLETAGRCGRQLQLGTNMRYMRRPRYLRELLASGEVGEPIACKAWGCHRSPPLWAPHYHQATSGGGALASTLVHGLDLALWVGGSPNPVSVSASMSRLFPGKRGPKASEEIRSRYDAEDWLMALVRCDNGATYLLEANWCDEVKDLHGFELVTTRGTLVSQPFRVLVDQGGEIEDRTPEIEEIDWGESVRAQDEDVIERLRQDKPLEMQDGRQLLNVQKLIDGCYESARRGREIFF